MENASSWEGFLTTAHLEKWNERQRGGFHTYAILNELLPDYH